MDNQAGKKELDYTIHHEDHKGYKIHWAISPSRSAPGKYMGHFFALKEGAATIRRSIANSFATSADAQNETIRLAKAVIDEAV